MVAFNRVRCTVLAVSELQRGGMSRGAIVRDVLPWADPYVAQLIKKSAGRSANGASPTIARTSQSDHGYGSLGGMSVVNARAHFGREEERTGNADTFARHGRLNGGLPGFGGV